MNYAIIENEKCTNSIVAEAGFAKQIGAVALPDGYGIGDTYKDGSWAKAAQPETALTDAEKEAAYDNLTVQYIREQYSIDDEAKVLREYLANATGAAANFNSYNTYVESCKAKAHTEIYGS